MRVKTARTSLTTQPLNPRLDKMIAAYATAAGAVGVAILAAGQPAEAKIVYTKTRVTITDITHTYALDLNHDGITDFNLGFCSCVPHGNGVALSSSRGMGNGAVTTPGYMFSAIVLKSGAPIGPAQMFVGAGDDAFMANTGSYGAPYSSGPWAGGKSGYLGLKFMINGQIHFGWARVTVTKHIGEVVLTGYAYETTANKHLKAGQTSEPPQAEAMNADMFALPAIGPGLGMLARGAEAMEIWHRKEKEQVV